MNNFPWKLISFNSIFNNYLYNKEGENIILKKIAFLYNWSVRNLVYKENLKINIKNPLMDYKRPPIFF